MPIHDWSRVDAGIFHDFHGSWITHIKESLNDGRLPEGYYALAEQHSGNIVPDVVALRRPNSPTPDGDGAIATKVNPPVVSVTLTPTNAYEELRRTLTIRHVSDDQIVGLIEIVSSANKDRPANVESFARKVADALRSDLNVLVIDIIPTKGHDPLGMHGAIWAHFDADPYDMPAGKPLALAAYCAERLPTGYIEPVAIGDNLTQMPMFLDPDWYVNVQLPETYDAAYRGVPQRWKEVIEA